MPYEYSVIAQEPPFSKPSPWRLYPISPVMVEVDSDTFRAIPEALQKPIPESDLKDPAGVEAMRIKSELTASLDLGGTVVETRFLFVPMCVWKKYTGEFDWQSGMPKLNPAGIRELADAYGLRIMDESDAQ